MSSTRTIRSTIPEAATVLVAAGACIVGVVAGRGIAWWGSVSEFGGITAAVLSFFVIVGVVGLSLIALIALKIRHDHMNRAIVTIFSAAALLAIGTIGGRATAGFTGGTYHEPVVLETMGATQIDLQPGVVPFVAKSGGRADCQSVADGRTVGSITALELGELGPGTLRAMIGVPATASDGAAAQFFIDGGDIPDGSVQPFWSGPVQISDLGATGASGTLTFTNLTVSDPAAKPDPGASVVPNAPSGWPATISGVVSWTCKPW